MLFGGAIGQDRVQGTELRPAEPVFCFGLCRELKPPFEGGFHDFAVLRLFGVRSRTFAEPPQLVAVDVTTLDRRHAAPFVPGLRSTSARSDLDFP